MIWYLLLTGIFGKKRRSVCPTCDKLDTKTMTSQQIVSGGELLNNSSDHAYGP